MSISFSYNLFLWWYAKYLPLWLHSEQWRLHLPITYLIIGILRQKISASNIDYMILLIFSPNYKHQVILGYMVPPLKIIRNLIYLQMPKINWFLHLHLLIAGEINIFMPFLWAELSKPYFELNWHSPSGTLHLHMNYHHWKMCLL